MWVHARHVIASTALVVAGIAANPSATVAQEPSRLSDDQVERLLERNEKSADKYRDSLDDALDKSKLDDSAREKEINRYVKEFEDATDKLEKHFDDKKAASDDVKNVLTRAIRLDNLMSRYPFTDRAQGDWRLLRGDLDELARAYGVAWEWTVATAAPR
jgi:hypothetical protein